MTDVTQGADAPDDNALFNEATSTDTLAKFENPPPVADPEPPAPPAPPAEKPIAKEPPDETAPVPPGRLREEADLRRKAERERDELRARLDAVQRPQPQPQAPQAKPDLFENPSGFVKEELRPYLEQITSQFQQQREGMSLDWALQKHGEEKVGAARQQLEQGMSRGDPESWSTYKRAMASHDPYGVIVKAYQAGETLRTVGNDLDGYKKRILEEALADPEYRKRAIEAAKSHAAASGNNVARPIVSSSPSLGNIGAAGGDPQVIEPSDAELFRAATTAKRR